MVDTEAHIPTGTTIRLLLVVTAVLATGSLIFMLLYLTVPSHRAQQVEALQRCFASADALPSAQAATRVARCLVPTALAQVSWAGYGLAILFGLAAVLYWLHPWWIIHRSRLRPLTAENSPELVAYLDGLSGEAGLRRAPMWLLAPFAAAASGLAFGRQRRQFVQLNAGLVTFYTTDRAAFRAVLMHELAHVRHRDTSKTYLAIAIWRAFVVVAAVPLVLVGIVGALGLWNWSVIGGWSDTLRILGALLALVALVYLSRNLFLRAREVEADAFAAAREPAFRRLVARHPTAGWKASVLRMGTHPHPARRLNVIDDPAMLLRPNLAELTGIGIAVGVLATNADSVLGLLFRPSALLVRGIIGFLTGLLLAGLLALALWRAAAGSLGRRQPWWTWPLPSVALAAGFLVGEQFSLLRAIVSDASLVAGGGLAAFAIPTVLLLVAGALLTGWTWSVSRHVLAPPAVAAAALAAAPWFAVWFAMHDAGRVFWTPTLGDIPAMGGEIGWYRTLAQWTDLGWPVLTFLSRNPFTLPGLALLWLVPTVVILRRGGRIGSTLITGAVGGLAVIISGIALAAAAKSLLPLDIRRDSTFAYVLFTTYVTAALLGQAVVAAIVAAGPRRPRPALVLLAVSVTAALAGLGWASTAWFSRCVDLAGTGTRKCAPSVMLTDIADPLHTILIKGVLVAIPAALIGAALGARYRRRTTTDQPPHRRPRIPAITVVLLPATMITAALVQLPRSREAWTPAEPELSTIDICIVGTWTETLTESHQTLTAETSVTLTASGMIEQFRADGTGTDDYGTGYVMTGLIPTGPLQGQRLEVAITGSATFTYHATDETIQFGGAIPTGTQTIQLNGKVVDTRPLTYTTEPERYTCQGDTMTRTRTSASGNTTTTHLKRTGPPR